MGPLEQAAVRMVPWVQMGGGGWVQVPPASARLFREGLSWTTVVDKPVLKCLWAEMDVFYSEDRRLTFRAFLYPGGEELLEARLEPAD